MKFYLGVTDTVILDKEEFLAIPLKVIYKNENSKIIYANPFKRDTREYKRRGILLWRKYHIQEKASSMF